MKAVHLLFASLLVSLFVIQNTAQPNDLIEVFIVTHSHDDVGWIMPWEDYYTTEVRSILNTVMQALEKDPKRKYTQVEVAFFRRWWNEVGEDVHQKVRNYIAKGQLEFNIGGITMNDEACTIYNQEINQLTDGHQWLFDTLGVRAASAWQIDPFGHSAATASLFSQVGLFPGMGINRIPYHVKDKMMAERGLEFVWRGSKSLGQKSEIWTHVMDSHYYPPPEMKFDDGWDINEVGPAVVRGIRSRRATWYRHNKQLITWGGDFFHQQAVQDYNNMDILMNYINSNPKYNMTLKYATFSDYIKSIHALDLTWDVYEGDFFPYWDEDHTFWTGYYTSKPWFKQYLRECDSLLSSAETMLTLTTSLNLTLRNPQWEKKIDSLRSATAVATHHDAVSGTENNWTENDYISALKNSSSDVRKTLKEMIPLLSRPQPVKLQENGVQYAVHNPLGWARRQMVSIVTNFPSATVTFQGARIPSQTNPVPSFSKVEGKYRLYFLTELAGLSTKIYDVQFSNQPDATVKVSQGAPGTLENSELSLQFDKTTGKLAYIKEKKGGRTIRTYLDYFQYYSEEYESPPSGAYIFRPASPSRLSPLKPNFEFSETFSSVPHVFSTASIDSKKTSKVSKDSFASSVHSVKDSGLSVQFFGEHPDLSADFAAWEDFPMKESFPNAKYLMGRSQVQSFKLESTVEFASATKGNAKFTRKPVIIVSAHSSQSESILVSVSSVSLNSFKIVLSSNCVDLEQVYVDWFAMEPSEWSEEHSNDYFYAGSVNVNEEKENILVNHPLASSDSLVLLTLESSEENSLHNVHVNGRGSNHFSAFIKNMEGKTVSGVKLHYIVATRAVTAQKVADRVTTVTVDGPLVKEVQQKYIKNYGQTFVVYKNPVLTNRGVVEIVNEVGPLNPQGRELVTRIQTSLNNSGIVYTDDNGMEIMQRRIDRTLPEPIAGNYYPMVQRTFIRDEAKQLQLTFISDSTHGVASLKSGQLEVMLHRRCLADDAKGVDEVLNDLTPIRPTLLLSLNNFDDATQKHRFLAHVQQFPPTIIKLEGPKVKSVQNLNLTKLPQNVHLLTLKQVGSKILLRLHHIYAAGEHSTLSQPVRLSLNQLLASFRPKSFEEMNLTGNIPLSQLQKMQWKTVSAGNGYSPIPLNGDNLVIQPMEIRTFMVTV